MSNSNGILYIVATPIGNLQDITQRALETFQQVDLIAAEDTRHSGLLLAHYGIKKPFFALHDHNEQQKAGALVEKLLQGVNIALISDAGTPLISDPGFHVVRQCRQAGVQVVPLPGLADMQSVFGSERYVVLAREITKTWETIHSDKLDDLIAWLAQDPNRTKGEMVVIVEGEPKEDEAEAISSQAMHALTLISQELPLKKAAAIVAELYGYKKNQLYQFGLELLR